MRSSLEYCPFIDRQFTKMSLFTIIAKIALLNSVLALILAPYLFSEETINKSQRHMMDTTNVPDLHFEHEEPEPQMR